MKKVLLIGIAVFLFINYSLAQQSIGKKEVDFTVYDSWNSLDKPIISNNGKWISYEINPYKGDGKLIVINPNRIDQKIFERGSSAVFSAQSKFIAFKIKSPFKLKIFSNHFGLH